jgi:two-component system phosphate regulon response regulator PhoB
MAPAVLIADADSDLCDLYRRFFSRHGWQVRTSAGGLECLAQLRQALPQLLILDWHLPWGGADGLLAVMRDDPGLARVPVILTSTEASPEVLPKVVSSPVVQALEKPFSLTVLLDLVRSRLGQALPAARTASRGAPAPDSCC